MTAMKWLNPNPRPHQTALAMIGAKPAQQVLMLGAGDGRLAAAVAGITGLNGRTLVIDPAAGARASIERAAADAGVLVEFEEAPLSELPSETGTFDLVVAHQVLRRESIEPARTIAEAARVIRPGGRVIVIEGEKPSGWRARLQPAHPPAGQADATRDALSAAGLRAARILAESEGVTYLEASKPR